MDRFVKIVKEWWKNSELNESEELLQQRFEDHKRFSANIFLFGAFIGFGLWIWDYFTDPEGAQYTFVYRLLFLALIFFSLIFYRVSNRHLLGRLAVAATLLAEANYLYILTFLNQGMLYGIGGFMYFMLMPPLALQAFSLMTNILAIVLLTFFPHLLAWSGFVEGFQHLQYAALIWPAAILAIMIQYFYARDYHKRYRLELALETLSYTDTLSGLNNRRYFMETFRKILRDKRQPFSLLIADIDHFKSINDRYGHPVGDRVIRAFALLCRRLLRDSDVLARIGGEEFGILLPETKVEEALMIAERIRKEAEKRDVVLESGEVIAFTVSIGVTQADTKRDKTQLIRESDRALYRAKRLGRNRVILYSERDER